jgi:CHAD domain-containing protein
MRKNKTSSSLISLVFSLSLRIASKSAREIRPGGNIEHLHRVRVAVRRLRNALWSFRSLFPEKKLARWKKSLRRVARESGEARDIDVKIHFLKQLRQEARDSRVQAGIGRIIALLMKKRMALQPSLEKAVAELIRKDVLRNIHRHVSALSRPSMAPGSETLFLIAEKKIGQRLRELAEKGSCALHPEKTEELHCLRITAKKLRYTLENFRPLYGKRLDRPIENAHAMQNLLGAIHDSDVWMQVLPGLLGKDPDEGTRQAGRFCLKRFKDIRRDSYCAFAVLWKKLQKRLFAEKLMRTVRTRCSQKALETFRPGLSTSRARGWLSSYEPYCRTPQPAGSAFSSPGSPAT